MRQPQRATSPTSEIKEKEKREARTLSICFVLLAPPSLPLLLPSSRVGNRSYDRWWRLHRSIGRRGCLFPIRFAPTAAAAAAAAAVAAAVAVASPSVAHHALVEVRGVAADAHLLAAVAADDGAVGLAV